MKQCLCIFSHLSILHRFKLKEIIICIICCTRMFLMYCAVLCCAVRVQNVIFNKKRKKLLTYLCIVSKVLFRFRVIIMLRRKIYANDVIDVYNDTVTILTISFYFIHMVYFITLYNTFIGWIETLRKDTNILCVFFLSLMYFFYFGGRKDRMKSLFFFPLINTLKFLNTYIKSVEYSL